MEDQKNPHKYAWEEWLRIILANLLFTLAYTSVNVPKGIINGGVTSFGMVLSRLIEVPIWLIVDGTILLLLLGCLFFLGKKYFFHSIISAICYITFFTAFTLIIPELRCPLLVSMAISSISVGIGCFLCISAQASTLGFDVVAMILHKKNPKIGIAQTMFLCNACVVLMGWATYGFIAIVVGLAGSGLQAFTLSQLLKQWPQELKEDE